jgi:hypothetical protein
MIFTENHLLTERLDVIECEQVEWGSWAQAHGFLDG